MEVGKFSIQIIIIFPTSFFSISFRTFQLLVFSNCPFQLHVNFFQVALTYFQLAIGYQLFKFWPLDQLEKFHSNLEKFSSAYLLWNNGLPMFVTEITFCIFRDFWNIQEFAKWIAPWALDFVYCQILYTHFPWFCSTSKTRMHKILLTDLLTLLIQYESYCMTHTVWVIQLSFKISVEQVLLPFCAWMRPTASRSRVTAITLITFFQLCSRKMELIVPFRFNLRLMNWNRIFLSRWKKEDTDEAHPPLI